MKLADCYSSHLLTVNTRSVSLALSNPKTFPEFNCFPYIPSVNIASMVAPCLHWCNSPPNCFQFLLASLIPHCSQGRLSEEWLIQPHFPTQGSGLLLCGHRDLAIVPDVSQSHPWASLCLECFSPRSSLNWHFLPPRLTSSVTFIQDEKKTRCMPTCILTLWG